MKKNFLVTIGLVVIVILYSCSNSNKKQVENEVLDHHPKQEDIINQGLHLVTIMGCNDCHSPKKMGAHGPEIIADKMLSGFPADRPIMKFDSRFIKEGFPMFYPDLTATAGPWGISFAGNLTPDETGIGNWSEEQFKKAMTQGKLKGLDGSRDLLPPMPWQNYKSLTNDEIHAIFTYLKSIRPVENIVPNPISPDKM
jgi:hypothetical protein